MTREKFPEICFFIENPKEYELLYYKEDDIHNEYALNLEEAKKIINTIESLQKENQELKKQLEDMTLCRDIASGHREEVQNRETLLLTQQKEFINYLEDEIQKQETVIAENQEKSYFLIYEDEKENLKLSSQKAYTRRRILEEILQKYKKIVGVKDEKES